MFIDQLLWCSECRLGMDVVALYSVRVDTMVDVPSSGQLVASVSDNTPVATTLVCSYMDSLAPYVVSGFVCGLPSCCGSRICIIYSSTNL